MCAIDHSIIGRFTTGSICFGAWRVSGRRRVPSPPTSTTALTGCWRPGRWLPCPASSSVRRGRSRRTVHRCAGPRSHRGRAAGRWRRRARLEVAHVGDPRGHVGLRRDRGAGRHERDRERVVGAEPDLVEAGREDLVRLLALGGVVDVVPLRDLELAVLAALALRHAFGERLAGRAATGCRSSSTRRPGRGTRRAWPCGRRRCR